jgi:hypothetical protein
MEWGRCYNTREGTTRLCSPDPKLSEGIEFIMNNQLQFLPKKKYIKKRYTLASKWRSFTEARKYARSLKLKSEEEWHKFNKGEIPDDIPSSPRFVYKFHGWAGFSDWLGVRPRYKIKYLPFSVARNFVRSLNIDNISEWTLYCNGEFSAKGIKPAHVPSKPNSVYKEKWISWLDWFGNGIVKYKERTYEPFIDARSFVHSLRLENLDQWYQYCRGKLIAAGGLPKTIPFFPHEIYRGHGWCGWRDWLGTRNIAPFKREFLPFDKARIFARKLELKNIEEWKKFTKGELPRKGELPLTIPADPRRKYKKYWKGYGDWLGTGTIATREKQFLPFLSRNEKTCFPIPW